MSGWDNDFEDPKTKSCPRCSGSTYSPATHYDKVFRDTVKCKRCDLQTLPMLSWEAANEIWDRRPTALLLAEYQGLVASILVAIRRSVNWIQLEDTLTTETLDELREAGYQVEHIGQIITWRKPL